MPEYKLSIRIAGNTCNPAVLALREKGYTLTSWCIFDHQGERALQFDAEKAGRLFSATDPVELLGLVAMWEVRGDQWQRQREEADLYGEFMESAITYDSEGNVVQD